MEIVRLRKLTRLSKLGDFSRSYKDRTVAEMLEHKPGYLIWVYFHVQHITFIDEILDELHIFERERIAKPGIDIAAYNKRWGQYKRKLIAQGRFDVVGRYNKKVKRFKQDFLEIAEGYENLSKATLQAINHGHIKI